MPVYIRTAAGTTAALNPLIKLPRQLRQLLVSIDGSTPTSTLAMHIPKDNDIDVLLEALQRAGLICRADPAGARLGDAAAPALRANGASSRPVREAARSPTESHSMLGSPSPLDARGASLRPQSFPLSGSPAPFLRAGTGTTRADAQPEAVVISGASPGLVDQGFASFGSETAPAGLRPEAVGSYELGNAISLMSNFVTQHLPDRSLEILLALESLTSVKQVFSSMDGYRALIAPIGQAAQHHLVELQHLLESA